jgi:hypothetical protein
VGRYRLTTRGGRGRLVAGVFGACLLVVLAWLTLYPPGDRLRLVAPLSGEIVGSSGVEVMVLFPPSGMAPETLRVTLNGADVTDAFTTGENGAYGRLVALLDGENRIEIGVFQHCAWFSSLLVERRVEVDVLHRHPVDADRG